MYLLDLFARDYYLLYNIIKKKNQLTLEYNTYAAQLPWRIYYVSKAKTTLGFDNGGTKQNKLEP